MRHGFLDSETKETRFLSKCVAEAFLILRGILKCTRISMSLQLDDASIGFSHSI